MIFNSYPSPNFAIPFNITPAYAIFTPLWPTLPLHIWTIIKFIMKRMNFGLPNGSIINDFMSQCDSRTPWTDLRRGHYEQYALRRLTTDSRKSAFVGGFGNHFLKETSQVGGRTKNWIMKRLLHGTDEITRLPLDVVQHCSFFVFPFQKFLCWKFRNFFIYEIKLLFTDFTFTLIYLQWLTAGSNYKGDHYVVLVGGGVPFTARPMLTVANLS